MKNFFMVFVLSIIIFIIGCAPVETPQTTEQTPSTIEPEVIDTEKDTVEEKKEISADVKELLSKAEQKIKSISYDYKGPETDDFFYKFYVKGNEIRYILNPVVKDLQLDDDSYESIFIKKATEFAGGYCTDRICKAKGIKATLEYDVVYIKTPFDWFNQIEFAEKLGEELIGKRKTWKLITDNSGIVWIDAFFGVPLQVEFNGDKYQFTQMTFNDVKDDDVILG